MDVPIFLDRRRVDPKSGSDEEASGFGGASSRETAPEIPRQAMWKRKKEIKHLDIDDASKCSLKARAFAWVLFNDVLLEKTEGSMPLLVRRGGSLLLIVEGHL